jgi:hypothetical protein
VHTPVREIALVPSVVEIGMFYNSALIAINPLLPLFEIKYVLYCVSPVVVATRFAVKVDALMYVNADTAVSTIVGCSAPMDENSIDVGAPRIGTGN